MARGDIVVYTDGAFGYPGDDTYTVASGTTLTIKAGEPVSKALGAVAVTALATTTNTAKPVVATDFVVGIASSDSTETTTAGGIVRVTKHLPGMSYLISPKTAASWDTQAEYDALVGFRVLFDFVTAGSWTILASDSATSGLVIMPLNIAKVPGKVRFTMRNGLNPYT